MAINDRGGWGNVVCNFCGTTRPHKLYISIAIATDDDGDYPYSQTDMCRECWDAYGIEAALEHNQVCRETCGTDLRFSIKKDTL